MLVKAAQAAFRPVLGFSPIAPRQREVRLKPMQQGIGHQQRVPAYTERHVSSVPADLAFVADCGTVGASAVPPLHL